MTTLRKELIKELNLTVKEFDKIIDDIFIKRKKRKEIINQFKLIIDEILPMNENDATSIILNYQLKKRVDEKFKE